MTARAIDPLRLEVATIVREHKAVEGQPALWLDDLKACPGVETYVIRPDDLEQLRRILARRHKP
jgi:hypothetical protein